MINSLFWLKFCSFSFCPTWVQRPHKQGDWIRCVSEMLMYFCNFGIFPVSVCFLSFFPVLKAIYVYVFNYLCVLRTTVFTFLRTQLAFFLMNTLLRNSYCMNSKCLTENRRMTIISIVSRTLKGRDNQPFFSQCERGNRQPQFITALITYIIILCSDSAFYTDYI